MFQVHERSIESGRGHNVCGGFATLKFACSRGQYYMEFVVPSGTKEEDSKFLNFKTYGLGFEPGTVLSDVSSASI